MINPDWTSDNSFDRSKGSHGAPRWPHEYMVKAFNSSSLTGRAPTEITEKTRILEIGSFGANNLRFFWEKGSRSIYGIEVTESLVRMCQERSREIIDKDFPIENIVKGSNLDIPHPDEYFDILVSVNTIHYCHGKEVIEALRLWEKKLKPGGTLFVATAGPEHDFVRDSQRLRTLEWRWGQKSGFRSGDMAGFFDDSAHWQESLESIFKDVRIGRVIEEGADLKLDFMNAVCTK